MTSYRVMEPIIDDQWIAASHRDRDAMRESRGTQERENM